MQLVCPIPDGQPKSPVKALALVGNKIGGDRFIPPEESDNKPIRSYSPSVSSEKRPKLLPSRSPNPAVPEKSSTQLDFGAKGTAIPGIPLIYADQTSRPPSHREDRRQSPAQKAATGSGCALSANECRDRSPTLSELAKTLNGLLSRQRLLDRSRTCKTTC